jgi:hypothetical protein
MTRTIPGRLDYARLADLHRPRTVEAIEAAILDLHRGGLTATDIASALRMRVNDVLAVLVEARHG